MSEQGIVLGRQSDDVFRDFGGVRRIGRDAERTDHDQFLAVHTGDQVDGVVVRRPVVAPVGEDEGVELVNHLVGDITDIVGTHMVGHRLCRRGGEFVAVARDGGEDDRHRVFKIRADFLFMYERPAECLRLFFRRRGGEHDASCRPSDAQDALDRLFLARDPAEQRALFPGKKGESTGEEGEDLLRRRCLSESERRRIVSDEHRGIDRSVEAIDVGAVFLCPYGECFRHLFERPLFL